MKFALACATFTAAIVAASPVDACRFSAPPKPPALPPHAERIVFTATLNERWGMDTHQAGADLRVSNRLLGEAPDHVDATWSRQEWTAEPISTATDGGDISQVIIQSCAGRAWYAERLRDALMGSELVVLARRTPSGVDVQDLALLDSEEGRRLSALADTP
ncbi:hypothetical protein [Brevundimonas sp.]|uniref:hypothetical protein n=1 Tax=Brevundimonas sp. TaxID=1871086 RepID=UPI002ED7D526